MSRQETFRFYPQFFIITGTILPVLSSRNVPDIAKFAFPLAAKSFFCAQMGILRRAHSVSSVRVVRTYLLLDILILPLNLADPSADET